MLRPGDTQGNMGDARARRCRHGCVVDTPTFDESGFTLGLAEMGGYRI